MDSESHQEDSLPLGELDLGSDTVSVNGFFDPCESFWEFSTANDGYQGTDCSCNWALDPNAIDFDATSHRDLLPVFSTKLGNDSWVLELSSPLEVTHDVCVGSSLRSIPLNTSHNTLSVENFSLASKGRESSFMATEHDSASNDFFSEDPAGKGRSHLSRIVSGENMNCNSGWRSTPTSKRNQHQLQNQTSSRAVLKDAIVDRVIRNATPCILEAIENEIMRLDPDYASSAGTVGKQKL